MTAVYTYSNARQNLASLLDQAFEEGEVQIKRKDGRVFVLKPVDRVDSPLDVPGIDLNISVSDIVAAIRESREWPRYETK